MEMLKLLACPEDHQPLALAPAALVAALNDEIARKCLRDAAGRFVTIEGDVPDLTVAIAGCPFAPRCPLTTARCVDAMPSPAAVAGPADHGVRCWQAAEQLAGYGRP